MEENQTPKKESALLNISGSISPILPLRNFRSTTDLKPNSLANHANLTQIQAENHSLQSQLKELTQKYNTLAKEHKEALSQDRDHLAKIKTLEEEITIHKTTRARLNKKLEKESDLMNKFKLSTKRNQDILVKRIRKTEQLLDYMASEVLVFCRYEKDQLLKKFKESFSFLTLERPFLGEFNKFNSFKSKMDDKLDSVRDKLREEVSKSSKSKEKGKKLGKNVVKSLRTALKNLQGLDIFNILETAKIGPKLDLTFHQVHDEYNKALGYLKNGG